MILYKISPTDNEVRRTDQVAQSVAAVRVGQDSLIDKVLDGECSFLTDIGAWVFGDTLFTSAGPVRVSDGELQFASGLDPKNGAPGNCDAHWIEVRKGGELVKRAVCVIAEGIDVKIPTAAGQV
jgi:hypothetical protein